MNKIKDHKWGNDVIIYEGAMIDESVKIGSHSIIYPNVIIKAGVCIKSSTIIGKSPSTGRNQVKLTDIENKTILNEDTFVGDQVIIYEGSYIGNSVYLADKCLIRENVVLHEDVVIGTSTVVSFNAVIGKGSKVMTLSNICGNMHIGQNVFIGVHVCAVTDNKPHELSERHTHNGPTIFDNVFIGSNTTLLPGVKVHEGITVASGSIITKDLKQKNSFYMGSPAKFLKMK